MHVPDFQRINKMLKIKYRVCVCVHVCDFLLALFFDSETGHYSAARVM